MRRVLRWFFLSITCVVGAAFCIELFSFAVVSATNYIVYGQVREGSRAIYDPYTLFLQSEPVRPTLHNSVSPDARQNRRIWMFGGSTMRGETDFDARTIPSFLSEFLNENTLGLHFSVINYGTDSFNSLLESKYIEKVLIESGSAPDLVVFYDGANDTKYFVEHRTADAHHGYRRVQALVESYYRSWFGVLKPINAAIYSSFTRELYDRLNQGLLPLDPAASELRTMVDKTEQRYDFIDKLTRAFGGKFVLIWQPMRWTESCTVNPAVAERERTLAINGDLLAAMRRNFTITYQALAERLSKKPYYTSFAEVLCGRTVAFYQPDGVHLNNEGRRAVANAMGQMIIKGFSNPAP